MRYQSPKININEFSFTADEEFDELCFDFGIELDEVVSVCTVYC